MRWNILCAGAGEMKRAREKDAENGLMIDNEIRWWWITNEHTKKMKSSSLFVCIHAAITHTIKAKQSKWIHNKNQRVTVMAIIRWLSMSWNSRNWLIQREHVHAMWVSVFQVLSCIEWSKTAATLYGIPIRPTILFPFASTCSPTLAGLKCSCNVVIMSFFNVW